MKTAAAQQLLVRIDGEAVLSVTRAAGVPGQLRAFLEQIEADMDAGIERDGVWIPAPDTDQRRHYVLGVLLEALAADRSEFARSLLTYLARSWPELAGIEIRSADGSCSLQLDPGA